MKIIFILIQILIPIIVVYFGKIEGGCITEGQERCVFQSDADSLRLKRSPFSLNLKPLNLDHLLSPPSQGENHRDTAKKPPLWISIEPLVPHLKGFQPKKNQTKLQDVRKNANTTALPANGAKKEVNETSVKVTKQTETKVSDLAYNFTAENSFSKNQSSMKPSTGKPNPLKDALLRMFERTSKPVNNLSDNSAGIASNLSSGVGKGRSFSFNKAAPQVNGKTYSERKNISTTEKSPGEIFFFQSADIEKSLPDLISSTQKVKSESSSKTGKAEARSVNKVGTTSVSQAHSSSGPNAIAKSYSVGKAPSAQKIAVSSADAGNGGHAKAEAGTDAVEVEDESEKSEEEEGAEELRKSTNGQFLKTKQWIKN